MRLLRAAGVAFLITAWAGGVALADCASAVAAVDRENGAAFVAGPVVWTGSFLAVAGTDRVSDRIIIRFLDELGEGIGSDHPITNSEGATLVDLVWTGDQLGLFFKDSEGDLVFQRVSPTGETIGDRTLPIGVPLSSSDLVEILWSPLDAAYVIVRTQQRDEREIWLTYVSTQARVISDDRYAVLEPGSKLAVAMADNGVIGIFHQQQLSDELHYLGVLRRGVVARKALVIAEGDLYATARGNQFGVAQSVAPAGEPVEVRWLRVDTSGNILMAERLLMREEGLEPLAFVASPSEFAFSYFDDDGVDGSGPAFILRRFTDNGTIITELPFAVADPRSREAKTAWDYVWAGSSYIAVGVEGTGLAARSFLTRYCPLTVTISGPMSARPKQPVTFSAVADGGVGGYAYAWEFAGRPIGQTNKVDLTFDQPGVYTITLTARDQTFTYISTTFSVTIDEPKKNPKRRAVRF